MRPRLLAALVLLAAAAPLPAQEARPVPPQVVPGARVRVTEAGPGARRFAGTVVQADAARLEVASRPRGRVLPWERVELIEVSQGSHTLRYGATGAAVGALLGAAFYKSWADERSPGGELNALAAAYRGAPVGAVAGMAAGLVLGRERWRTVGGTSVLPFLAPGGGGVSLRVR